MVAESFVPVSASFGGEIVKEGDRRMRSTCSPPAARAPSRPAPAARSCRSTSCARATASARWACCDGAEARPCARAATSGAPQLGKAVFQALTCSAPADHETFSGARDAAATSRTSSACTRASRISNAVAEPARAGARAVEVPAGELIVARGRTRPGAMYIVEQGRVQAFRERGGPTARTSPSCARATSSARSLLSGASSARPPWRRVSGVQAAAASRREASSAWSPSDPRLPAAASRSASAVRLSREGRRAARLRPGAAARGSGGRRAGAGPGGAGDERSGPGRAVRGRGRPLRQEAARGGAASPTSADRRDGLRRGLPGDDLPSLRARGEPAPHPPARARQPGRHQPARDLRGRDLARAGRPRESRRRGRTSTEMPLPAVIHWGGNHWVVLYDVDDAHALDRRPRPECRRVPRAELDEKWTGYAALFDYTQEFEEAPEGRPGLAWLWPFVRPYAPAPAARPRPGPRGERAADDLPHLHAGGRGPRAGGAGPRPPALAHAGHGRGPGPR